MAIAPTGAIYKALSFDNTSSRTYGVYITGEAVYNAPERDVEMITIPGRNGAFALDNGRFQNITVSYPAGIFASTEADFAQAISDFRNFLCSKKGYCRLTDEYNPNEYRMAVYKSGLEVDPAQLRAGEFDITFECKPQRFLTSGETKTTIATSGSTITNPTLFDASPMLEVNGYGTIGINGEEVEIISSSIGLMEFSKATTYANSMDKTNPTPSFTKTCVLSGVDSLNNGDEIYIDKDSLSITLQLQENGVTLNSLTETSTSGLTYTTIGTLVGRMGNFSGVKFTTNPSFSKGTSGSVTGTIQAAMVYSTSQTDSLTLTITASYDGSDTITISASIGTISQYTSGSKAGQDYYYVYTVTTPISTPSIYGVSTKTVLGAPIYIDLEYGEAWKVENGVVISVNSAVVIPTILPMLSSGANTITFDNTVNKLDIVPRWWKV